MNGLTPAQHAQLLTPLDTGRINKLRGMSHLEAWDVRRWLIRIFGFTGWSFEVVETVLAYENIVPNEKGVRATVVYRATGRLRIRDEAGNELAVFEDAATGDGVNMPSVGDAHDFALKTAVSQALKRCAANLGDQFGLSLYNNGNPAPVVLAVLARTGESPVALPVDPPVAPEPEVPGEPERPAQRHQGPVEDEWNQPAPSGQLPPPSPLVPKADQKQQARMAILLKEKRGISDDAEARAAIAAMMRRPLKSRTELSKAEANNVITTLTAEPDWTPLEDNPVRDILLTNIKDASSPSTLDAAGRDIVSELARGSITPAESDWLKVKWMVRRDVLRELAAARQEEAGLMAMAGAEAAA